MTKITSKRRRLETPWCAEPDTLDRILGDLEKHTLSPELGAFGFIDRSPQWIRPADAERYAGCAHVLGNFDGYSGAFEVITDDADVLERLSAAIARNMATPEYAEAKRRYEQERAERKAAMAEDHQHRIALSEVIHGK
jgi:hypothetical protein